MDDTLTQLLLKGLMNSGPIGVVLGIMLWFNYKLVLRLFAVIETNTKVLTINNEKLLDLAEAQKKRRTDFQ